MDKFTVTNANSAGCLANLNMGYYDGNTVEALWNYAQHYALNDTSSIRSLAPPSWAT